MPYFEQALSLYGDISDRWGEANTLQLLGNAYPQMGRLKEGVAAAYRAQEIFQELDLSFEVMPYPNWVKQLVKFGQQGRLQVALCFIGGMVAFPVVLVVFASLFIWRIVRSWLN